MNTYIETIESIEAQAIESLIKNIKDHTTLKKHQGL
jgi:hypothetical protein